MIYTTPIFNAPSPAVGPAPGTFHQFHSSSSSANTPSPASSVLSHHHIHHNHPHHLHDHRQQSSPNSSSSSIKMEPDHDLHAQEAAAREYQPNLQVSSPSTQAG